MSELTVFFVNAGRAYVATANCCRCFSCGGVVLMRLVIPIEIALSSVNCIQIECTSYISFFHIKILLVTNLGKRRLCFFWFCFKILMTTCNNLVF